MNNVIKTLLFAFVIAGLLAGCAQPNPHPMDMSAAVQSAKTRTDHEALATHYEQAARDAEAAVKEHRSLLDQYKAQSYLYGRQAATVQAHCEALIRSYEQVAKANKELAALHHSLGQTVK
ncbi:hypothetical protein [Methylococcus sp. EFPC2]|uniref:hypothetical protein n=1 Tax=Methylococcus sp. EFPC2 TaxID=2812648 RepID=UPI0019688E7A|nr:hypothetical protein [Methylococcus sp. EFPC2]QSA96881.1 hypothetical protein JWZ97_17010 [Methylococcus sp. EFPC2]